MPGRVRLWLIPAGILPLLFTPVFPTHKVTASGITGTLETGHGPAVGCLSCHPERTRRPPGTLFPTYSSGTMDATPGQPKETSRLCLSCHDGSVAIDPAENGGTAGFASGPGGITGSLKNDHPIGFVYDRELARRDGSLRDPSGIGPLKLFEGRLECLTCHDVHENRYPGMLRMSNSGSSLCLRCHRK